MEEMCGFCRVLVIKNIVFGENIMFLGAGEKGNIN